MGTEMTAECPDCGVEMRTANDGATRCSYCNSWAFRDAVSDGAIYAAASKTTAPEVGLQRRTTEGGRPLHCCVICGVTGAWTLNWSSYCSEKEIDDGDPIAKFCCDICVKAAGNDCANVTADMKRAARDAEWRPPKPYIAPPRPPSYADAAYAQKKERDRQARISAVRAARSAETHG